VAARRIPAYLVYDLIECVYHGAPSAWMGGILDAWRDRDALRHHRDPVPKHVVARVEMNRGRMHARQLVGQLRKRLAALRRDR
jgi:hypothetical protein